MGVLRKKRREERAKGLNKDFLEDESLVYDEKTNSHMTRTEYIESYGTEEEKEALE